MSTAYGSDPYSHDGYDTYGFDRNGYDRTGFDRDGYDMYGYDRHGFGQDGRDRRGRDRAGFYLDGYDDNGYDRDGRHRTTPPDPPPRPRRRVDAEPVRAAALAAIVAVLASVVMCTVLHALTTRTSTELWARMNTTAPQLPAPVTVAAAGAVLAAVAAACLAGTALWAPAALRWVQLLVVLAAVALTIALAGTASAPTWIGYALIVGIGTRTLTALGPTHRPRRRRR